MEASYHIVSCPMDRPLCQGTERGLLATASEKLRPSVQYSPRSSYKLTTIQCCTGCSSHIYKARKRNKMQTVERSKNVFIHRRHACLYTKSEGDYKKLLELLTLQLLQMQSHLQTLIIFLCASNYQKLKKHFNAIYGTMKNIKCFWMNLRKDMEHLYTENYQTLLREIKDQSNGKRGCVHGLEDSMLLRYLFFLN